VDQIYKLQPHRTLSLQGFDDYGAAAALWGASETGFTISGVFRDMADFAVLVLFQKDDPFGHPLFSYLPDGDLTGLALDFDVTWQGIQSWESLKNAWTDWNALDYSNDGVGYNTAKWFGTSGITITCNTQNRTGASATFTLNLNGPQPGDKVTLWYQNQSFISPALSTQHPTADQIICWQGNAAYNHWVTIGSAKYSCLEGSLPAVGIASNIAFQINASDPNCTAITGGTSGNEIFITLKSDVSGPLTVSSSDGSAPDTLTQATAASILQSIAQQINAVNWVQNGPVVLTAGVSLPNQLVVTAAPGADGNMVAFYQTDNTGGTRLYFTARFAGLDPTREWLPKTKRPWNADLKHLCSKIGESFVAVAGREGDFYGKLYAQRKALEQERNEAGQFAEQAHRQLERLSHGENKEAYAHCSRGRLTPAHIHARAKRWAVKLFLAHYHHVAWKVATGQDPPKPYVIAHLYHGDLIGPPNFETALEMKDGRAVRWKPEVK
jgi:hypothetical protein